MHQSYMWLSCYESMRAVAQRAICKFMATGQIYTHNIIGYNCRYTFSNNKIIITIIIIIIIIISYFSDPYASSLPPPCNLNDTA